MKQAKKPTNSTELDAIAERLKHIRKEKGYSNYEAIAHELGMSRSAYWRLESGANFELKTLIKVCRLLNVTLEEFFTGIDYPKADVKKQKQK